MPAVRCTMPQRFQGGSEMHTIYTLWICIRRATFAAALLVCAAMFSIARSHHPLGPLLALLP
jgi:hypothetical protein